MKKWMIVWMLIFAFSVTAYAKEEPEELYAQSAVLMDADSGRVLFEKNGTDAKAMASTTKIMTCILALECGNLEDTVTFSDYAASQPEVHLNATSGETFYLKDLLYSLMLESHNDTAVAIAESVSGDVGKFADMMNQKAKEIGCENTYFITPNGLDASDENGFHSTTAEDLARIMSYCITKSPQKEVFLEITSTTQYSFTNLEGNKTYSCTNHNAFLNMMDEAISGKTGFTADAGYCYVGAVESEGRTFVVSLLACGWPNNKNYKWADMKKLVMYGMENYEYRTIDRTPNTADLVVLDGVPESGELFGEAKVSTKVEDEDAAISVLMHEEEKLKSQVEQIESTNAPVKSGDEVGKVTYYLDDEVIAVYPIVCETSVERKDFTWYFEKLIEMYTI